MRSRAPRNGLALLLAASAACAAPVRDAAPLLSCPEIESRHGFPDVSNRMWRSIEVLETLSDPVGVRKWNEEGLVLEDGRSLQFPPWPRSEARSAALAEALREGTVEVRHGCVFARVRVWHWCGNDPIFRHAARVNIGELMRFLDHPRAHEPTDDARAAMHRLLTGFSHYGWDVGYYHDFCDWRDKQLAASGRPPAKLACRVVERAFHEGWKTCGEVLVYDDGAFWHAQTDIWRTPELGRVGTRIIGGRLPESLRQELLSMAREGELLQYDYAIDDHRTSRPRAINALFAHLALTEARSGR